MCLCMRRGVHGGQSLEALALLLSPDATLVSTAPWDQSTNWEKAEKKKTPKNPTCLHLLHPGLTPKRVCGLSHEQEGSSTTCFSLNPIKARVPQVGAGGTERIQLDGSGAGADGQDAQRQAVAKGAGLVWEAMLHRLQREPCRRGPADMSPLPPMAGEPVPDRGQHRATPSRKEQVSHFQVPTQTPECRANPRPTSDPVLGPVAIRGSTFSPDTTLAT